MPRRSNRRNGPARPNPEVMSVAELQALPRNSLILMASASNLVTTGTKNLLAQRVFEHEHNKNNGAHTNTRTLHNPPTVPQREQQPPDTHFSAAQLSQLRDLVNEAVSSQRSGSLQLANSSLEVPPLSPASGLHVISPHANGGLEPFTEPSPRLQIQDGASPRPQQQQQHLEPSPSLARQNNEPLLQGATPQGDFYLPPLPEKLRSRILKREYVDFNELLSDNMYPHPAYASSQSNFTLAINPQDSTSLTFVPSHRRKCRIDGLSSWLEAWNVFVRTLLSHFPQLAPDLLAYQDQICKFSHKFKASAWLMYDTAFRYMAASNSSLAWSKLNEQLYNDILKEETMVIAPLPAQHEPSQPSPFVPYQLPLSLSRLTHPHPLLPPTQHVSSSRSHLPFAVTTIAASAAAPTVSSNTSATRQIAEVPTLASSAPNHLEPSFPATSLQPSSTPVNISQLSAEIQQHPDQQFAQGLLHDLRFGCNIGYSGPRSARITPNLQSALLHPEAVSETLAKELSRGHTAGPFPSPPLPNLQCSPLGVVPKKDGTWRIIMDLSSPHGSSINDHISKGDYTLHYTTFDNALTLIARHGQNALMAKLDIKHAFRLCPICLEDRELLGIHWNDHFYVDLRLPFGLRSSPYLFNRLADAFQWILIHNYHIHDLMHYLDDYFTVGPANSSLCANNVFTVVRVASDLGIPLAPDKLEGPTTSLVFLGITIDTIRMETSLPADKLCGLLVDLQSLSSRKKCQKRELLSLIGKLNFACRVIPAGRIFLRRLIDLSTTARLPHHHITMNQEARQDIAWWLKFLPSWNGRAIIPDRFWTKSADLELFTDASGTLGYGIYYRGHWIANSWPPILQDRSIQWKELYPIAVACLLWGHQWSGKKLLFHCDNQSVSGHLGLWHFPGPLDHAPCSLYIF